MSCNSCSNITLPQGAQGPQGASGTDGTDGTDGLNGIFGGFSMEFDFDSSNFSTPPLGEIRFNNATLSSVTEIFVSTTGTGSTNAAPFLDSFDDNGDPGNYGLIRVFKQHDSTVFWLGRVTAIAPSGASRTLTVQYIASGSDPFNDGDDTIVSFVSNGASGASKSGAIYNYSILDNGYNRIGTSFQLMNTFNIPANTFEQNMDEISLKGGFSGFKTPNADPGKYVFKVEIDGQDVIDPLVGGWNLGTMTAPYSGPGVGFEMKFYRTASNKLRPVILYKNIYFVQSGIGGNDISVSDAWAANGDPYIGDPWNFNLANISLPEITCPTAFTSALTVNIYMRATTPSLDGRIDAPAFRVMNLHASYNKI